MKPANDQELKMAYERGLIRGRLHAYRYNEKAKDIKVKDLYEEAGDDPMLKSWAQGYEAGIHRWSETIR